MTGSREAGLRAFQACLSDPELIVWRTIRDTYAEAQPEYWEKRAKTFEAIGTDTARETAQAFRAKAAVLRCYGVDGDDIEWAHQALLEAVEA